MSSCSVGLSGGPQLTLWSLTAEVGESVLGPCRAVEANSVLELVGPLPVVSSVPTAEGPEGCSAGEGEGEEGKGEEEGEAGLGGIGLGIP